MATKKRAQKGAKGVVKERAAQIQAIDEIPSSALVSLGDIVMHELGDAAHSIARPGAENTALAYARSKFAEVLGFPSVPDGSEYNTEKAYLDYVAGMFGVTVLFTACEPTTMSAEINRFIKALETIKKGKGRGKRRPDILVVRALAAQRRMSGRDWDDSKKDWLALCRAAWPEEWETWPEDKQKEKREYLQQRMRSYKSAKKTRAKRGKSTINITPPNVDA
jgi:hypothetical protein